MHLNILSMKDLNTKIKDEQIKAKYDENVAKDPHVYDAASVSHILIALKDPNDNTKDLRTKEEAKKLADEVKQKLSAGGDFAALAKEYSDDPGSKDTGGSYANERLATTSWVAEFKEHAETQPVGQVGDPFETTFGYHIMKVDKRGPATYEEVKSELQEQLVSGLMSDFIEKELPALKYKSSLPAPSPSPSAASPEASPAASPEASANP